MLYFLIQLFIILAHSFRVPTDPKAFAQLLTDRLHANVSLELKDLGVLDGQILVLLEKSHDRFKRQVPELLQRNYNPALSLVQVAEQTQTQMGKRLEQIYKDEWKNSLQKRTMKDTLLSNLHNLRLDELIKIKNHNIGTELVRIQELISNELKPKRDKLASNLSLTLMDTDILGDDAWKNLKMEKNKDLVIELLDIEYELNLARMISSWLLSASEWIEDYEKMKTSGNLSQHLNDFIVTLSGKVDEITGKASLSVDERLQNYVDIFGNDIQDFITELRNHRRNTPNVEETDNSSVTASKIFVGLNKKLKRSIIPEFLSRHSTIFFLSVGVFLFYFYYAGLKNEEDS